eukprot:14256315-Alexandrium_andersonii.AAC.1
MTAPTMVLMVASPKRAQSLSPGPLEGSGLRRCSCRARMRLRKTPQRSWEGLVLCSVLERAAVGVR